MPEGQPKIAIIILAAGASTRMGQPKQLLSFGGKSLLQRVIKTAQDTPFRPIVAVLGARSSEISQHAPAEGIHLAFNTDWEQGMGGSVAIGLKRALQLEDTLEAAFFLVVDQPYLHTGLLLTMAGQVMQSPQLGAAAAYQGALGVPALFRRPLFDELLALKGQKGAKPLIHKYRDKLLAIPFPEGQSDLDTPEDWQRFLEGEKDRRQS